MRNKGGLSSFLQQQNYLFFAFYSLTPRGQASLLKTRQNTPEAPRSAAEEM
jgi:hypothetical protein